MHVYVFLTSLSTLVGLFIFIFIDMSQVQVCRPTNPTISLKSVDDF